MNLLAVLYLALLLRTTAGAGDFAVRHGDRLVSGPVMTLTVLPGKSVTFEAPASTARALAGRLTGDGQGGWTWIAPSTPGLYPIQVIAGDQRDSITINAFVLVPFNSVSGEHVNGYRIGRYARNAPSGFIEVTRANSDVFVSPHFRLGQFLCKQAGGYPKYVVLDDQLLNKLEYLLERVNAAGYSATTFHIMSGYRTPAYNRALGNVPNSRHTAGAAADIFIDEDGDGVMDDLNRDGRHDVGDAEVLYRLFDSVSEGGGGLGKYRPTAAHGAFVHVDVRDRKARW